MYRGCRATIEVDIDRSESEPVAINLEMTFDVTKHGLVRGENQFVCAYGRCLDVEEQTRIGKVFELYLYRQG